MVLQATAKLASVLLDSTPESHRNAGHIMKDEADKYHEDYLKKKEGKKKWPEFWVVLEGCSLVFYKNNSTRSNENYRGCIDITPDSKCVIGKRKTYSYPFILMTRKGNHLFKCCTAIQRHKWMYVLGLASKRSPPSAIPSLLATQTKPTEDGMYLGDWGSDVSRNNNKVGHSDEDDDVISDEDNDVDDDILPPGVLIVTEPLNRSGDLHDGNSTPAKSTFKDFCAVEMTGLGGITVVKQIPKEQRPAAVYQPPKMLINSSEQIHRSSTPKLGRITWTSHDDMRPRTSPMLNHATGGFLSSARDIRPNSSPEMGSKIKQSRDPSGTPLSSGLQSSRNLNVRFSRHLVSSAPDLHMKVEEI